MLEWVINGIESLFDFSYILNSSIAASWLVLAVVVLRFLLKKAPKWTCVALWGLVAVRLLLPFSIESAFSLVPSAQIVPEEILRYEGTKLHEPAHLDVISNPNFLTDVSIELEQTVDRVQIRMFDMAVIWILGVLILLLYAMVSYWRLYRKVNTAVRYQDNIFQSEHVNSPFVLGIIRPRIYLPFNITEENLKHVVSHEQAHIRRKDHWWKPLGFFLLSIHWFNPLMWLAYVLLCRDIELACDEKVIKELGKEQRADYTQALVVCSVKNTMISACPIAFGEVGVRDRVKSIMNYKKPTFWIMLASVVSCVIVAVCFLTNPKERTESSVTYFDNIMGLTGFYSEDAMSPSFMYNYYVMEGEKAVCIAEHWGDAPENSCFSKDLDGDGISELICNVTYGDGVRATVVYHREGNQIFKGYADDLLDEKYDNLHPASAYSYYIPEEDVVEIHYWLEEIGGYKSKKYEIDLDKIIYWETFAELGKYSFDQVLVQHRDMTYQWFVRNYDIDTEHYHADYYIAPIRENELYAVFRATGFDDTNAMAVLLPNDHILRLEGKLSTFLSGLREEMTVPEFIEGLTWKDVVPEYVMEKGAGTAYYVADEYLKVWIDSDEDFNTDFVLHVALNTDGKVVPEASTWLYWE